MNSFQFTEYFYSLLEGIRDNEDEFIKKFMPDKKVDDINFISATPAYFFIKYTNTDCKVKEFAILINDVIFWLEENAG